MVGLYPEYYFFLEMIMGLECWWNNGIVVSGEMCIV